MAVEVRCNDCGATEGVHIVIIENASEEDAKPIEWPFCTICLTSKNLFCVRHQTVKVCLYDPEVCLSENSTLLVLSACHECAYEAMLKMEPFERHHIASALREHGKADLFNGLAERLDAPELGSLNAADKVVFGLLVCADMHNATLEQTVTDLITERAERPVN